MADPGFPRGGGANSLGGAPTYDFAKNSPKLHEIERIWTRGGVPCAPLRSATGKGIMLYNKMFLIHLIPKFCLVQNTFDKPKRPTRVLGVSSFNLSCLFKLLNKIQLYLNYLKTCIFLKNDLWNNPGKLHQWLRKIVVLMLSIGNSNVVLSEPRFKWEEQK